MSRRKDPEAFIMNWFETSPLDAAVSLLAVAKRSVGIRWEHRQQTTLSNTPTPAQPKITKMRKKRLSAAANSVQENPPAFMPESAT